MFINGKEYKPYDDYYYVSQDGDVYSKYINRSMKHNIDIDGYHRVDIHGRHMKVHKLVYITWVGDIEPGMLIRHYWTNKELTFCPAEKFIDYSGHSCQNGGISRIFTRDWFKQSFEVIEYRLGKV